ncbi:MAG: hypothetical protein ABI690_32655 [Chloroflexota bacterium]
MAIPKKGSRKIAVDSVEYRWYVRHKPTYMQEIFPINGDLVFAVERLAENVTSILIVEMPFTRPDAITGKSIILKPADIATHIRAALAAGWTPLLPGAPFIYKPGPI